MSNELDVLEEKISKIVSDLENLQSDVLDECKKFAVYKFDEIVRSTISNHPEKVQQLGHDGLKPIKIKAESIKENLPILTENKINQDELWLHRQAELTSNNCPFHAYHVYRNGLPDTLKEVVRSLLSPAGNLLLDSGLANQDEWRNKGDYIRYNYGFDVTEGLKKSIRTYSNLFDQLSRLLEEKKTLSAKLTSDGALALWDEV